MKKNAIPQKRFSGKQQIYLHEKNGATTFTVGKNKNKSGQTGARNLPDHSTKEEIMKLYPFNRAQNSIFSRINFH